MPRPSRTISTRRPVRLGSPDLLAASRPRSSACHQVSNSSREIVAAAHTLLIESPAPRRRSISVIESFIGLLASFVASFDALSLVDHGSLFPLQLVPKSACEP